MNEDEELNVPTRCDERPRSRVAPRQLISVEGQRTPQNPAPAFDDGPRSAHVLRMLAHSGIDADVDVHLVSLNGLRLAAGAFGNDTSQLARSQALARLCSLAAGDGMVAALTSETAIVLRRATGRAPSLDLAVEIVNALSDPVDTPLHQLHLTVAVGVARTNRSEKGWLIRVLGDAQQALNEARAGRRDRTALYDTALRRELGSRHRLSAAIVAGLRRGEFFLHEQQIVRADDRSLVEVEALIRWDKPLSGVVPPRSFIPHAEQFGLIAGIDRFVVATAADLLALPPERSPAPPRMSINISATTAARPDFAADLLAEMQERDADTSRLIVEITESAVFDDVPTTAANMCRLQEAGVEISLDDFGTGFSSLTQIREIPLNRIKIDRSLIRQLDEPSGRAIIEYTIGMAHALGLTVTAEGVETEQQATVLNELHCDLLQGFYFGRPQPRLLAPISPRHMDVRLDEERY